MTTTPPTTPLQADIDNVALYSVINLTQKADDLIRLLTELRRGLHDGEPDTVRGCLLAAARLAPDIVKHDERLTALSLVDGGMFPRVVKANAEWLKTNRERKARVVVDDGG